MPKREFRLGGGLNLRASEDVIDDADLLLARHVRFDEPGALIVEKPPVSLQGTLLTCTSQGGRTATVMGIFDALFNSTRYVFLKNTTKWQYATYTGGSPTSLLCADGVFLPEGATGVTYSGTTTSYTVPATGSIVITAWGGGGGGPSSDGSGTTNGGGGGGFVKGTLAVAAGAVITFQIGQGGGGGQKSTYPNRPEGGYPDGGGSTIGAAGYGSGTGGGSTRVFYNGILIMVAGGGGGSALTDAGAGGGTSGAGDPGGGGGTGGSQSAPGEGSTSFHRGGDASGRYGGYGMVDYGYAGGGGGGGFFGGGGGGTTNTGVPYSGSGGSGYVNATYLTSTSNTAGSTETPGGVADPSYSATAGQVAGNPATNTAAGGLRDATSSDNDGNYGGNGYAVANYTKTGSNAESTDLPVYDWEHQLSGFAYRGNVYMSDGYYFRRLKNIAGSYTLQRVGVEQPVPPSAAVESAGGLTVAGVTYKWAVSFWNGTAESNLSEAYAYTAVNTNYKITITVPVDPLTGSGTVSRRVYRTNPNGTAMFFVAEINDNSTTSFPDLIDLNYQGDANASANDAIQVATNADLATLAGGPLPRPYQVVGTVHEQDAIDRGEIIQGNLGVLADWTDHDAPETDQGGTVRNLRFLDDVAYGIVDNNSLAFSLMGGVEYWSPYNRVFIGKENGETLCDIQAFQKHMICYTDLGVWRFRRYGQDASESILEKVTNAVGVCSENAVAVTEDYGHIFMARDGIYRFDGENVTKISYAIDDMFLDTAHADYIAPTKMVSVVSYAKNNVVMFAFRQGSDTNNNKALIVDLTTGDPKFSTTYYNYDSLHKGYDGAVFGGTTSNTLLRVDPGAISSGPTTATFRTKLFPIEGQPETLAIDANFYAQSAIVSIYRDSYDNIIASFTVVPKEEDGRDWYICKLPLVGSCGRIGVQVQIVMGATATAVPKVYRVALYSEDGVDLIP